MDSKVVYEGKYPQITDEDCEQLYSLTSLQEKHRSVQKSSEVLCRKLFESTVRVLMPERLEGKEYFVKLAKQISEAYELNTIVTEHDDRIIARFEVDCYNQYPFFQKIILLSDEIGFDIINCDVILSVTYYTHATYRSGRRITPQMTI